MKHRSIAPLACLVLAVGLSGCFLLPKPAHHWAKVTPIPIDKSAVPNPYAREDEMYARAVRAIEQRTMAWLWTCWRWPRTFAPTTRAC